MACADAAPVIDAVARNAIARHFEIMMFLHSLGKQQGEESLVPETEQEIMSVLARSLRTDAVP